MSSKAIMFTPEKNLTEPEWKLKKRERGENHCLGGCEQESCSGLSTLSIARRLCPLLALGQTSPGEGRGKAERDEERSLRQERAVSPEALV